MGGSRLKSQLSFIVAVILLQASATIAVRHCSEALDVVFVVDGTVHSTNSNVNQRDLRSLKHYLKSVSDKLFKRKTDLRIAQVTYGSEGQRQFNFTQNWRQASNFIDKMGHHDGPPNIREGVMVARKLIQEQIFQSRRTVVLLVAADTSYHEQNRFTYEGDPENLPIIAVGYTNAVDVTVLQLITGTKLNILQAANSRALRYIVNRTVIKLLLCPEEEHTTFGGRISKAASKRTESLDVVFVVNVAMRSNSTSVEMTNLRNYLIAVSNYLFDRVNVLRIAQIVFGSNTAPSGGGRFSFHYSKHAVQTYINQTQYMDGPANVIAAVKKAVNFLKTYGRNVPRSILLVTERTKVRNTGRNPPFRRITLPPIVAVGYTDFVHRNILLSIAKDDSDVFLVSNSSALLSIANNTAMKLLGTDEDKRVLVEPPASIHSVNTKIPLTSDVPPTTPVTIVANKEVFQNVSQEAKDDPARFNAEVISLVKAYDGPVEDYLEFEVFVEVLPKYRMANLTIADVDRKSPDIFNSLPDTKKLALTRQTLAQLPYSDVQPEVEDNFRRKGCGFVESINVSILMQPGHVSRDLALDMCNCSENGSQNIPTKMDTVCKIIFTDTNTLQDFIDIQDRLCALCFAYILKERPNWQKVIVTDQDMRNAACNKIGQSFALLHSMLAQWALICIRPSNHSVCEESWPSLMLHGPSPPSVADLAVCKDVFCHRLCHLTEAEIDVIHHTVNHQHSEDMGCLSYLDGVNPTSNMNPHQAPTLNATSIAGSCSLKSRVIKRAKEAARRQKRACSITCEDISSDIEDGIVPSHVLDARQLESCFNNDLYKCVEKNNLGDYHWDIDQAKAIFNRLRRDLTFKHFQNSTIYNTEVLGYIGLGFTPDELAAMEGTSPKVYSIFGATYGWSKEQLQTLASRYVQDITPRKLNDVDLARLNHLICGLRAEQVREIPIKAIKNTTPILGKMQRCEIKVLEVLAERLILYYGPIIDWPEDHFSEFGIILAGVKGEELRGVGRTLVDHITVAVVNHIPPTEFWKLSPEKTSLLSYDVSLALSRRGLCAWITDRHKQGYLEYLCNAGNQMSHGIAVLIIAVFTFSLREYS